MLVLHSEGDNAQAPYLLLVGVNDAHGVGENLGHVHELVSHLLAGHALQGGALWAILALALGQVHPEVNALRAVVDANLTSTNINDNNQ